MRADPMVRRVAIAAAVVCVVSAAVAGAAVDAAMAFGVLGGGLLIAISFATLGSGVAAIVALAAGPEMGGAATVDPAVRARRTRRLAAQTLVKLVLRYALLGFLAYVMIARLRLHPIGLMVGATSIVAAVFIEAVRLHTKSTS